MTGTGGAPCWMDLLTSETARAREFYGRLLGWSAGEAAPDFDGYFMFMLDGVPVAGCMPAQAGMDVADVWGVYLSSADARATAERAAAAGAAVRVPAMEVADLGTQVMLDDPVGARIGIWQPGTFPGFGAVGTGRPGTPAYFELHTRAYADAVGFYRDVFGWDAKIMSDAPELRMTATEVDGRPAAGILDSSAYMPAGEGSRWDVYITVADTDMALARAIQLGGTVHQEAISTPMGRLGVAADPMGARVWLVSGGAA